MWKPVANLTFTLFLVALLTVALWLSRDWPYETALFPQAIGVLGVKHELADEVMQHYRDAQPTPKSRIGVAELPRQLLAASDWLAELEEGVRGALGNVPLLLTWGLHDLAFPRRYMERFREDFRLARVHRLDAKHFIQEDAPAEIASAIDEFLSSLEPAAAPGSQ